MSKINKGLHSTEKGRNLDFSDGEGMRKHAENEGVECRRGGESAKERTSI